MTTTKKKKDFTHVVPNLYDCFCGSSEKKIFWKQFCSHNESKWDPNHQILL